MAEDVPNYDYPVIDLTGVTAGTYDYFIDLNGVDTASIDWQLDSGSATLTLWASSQNVASASARFEDITNTYFGVTGVTSSDQFIFDTP